MGFIIGEGGILTGYVFIMLKRVPTIKRAIFRFFSMKTIFLLIGFFFLFGFSFGQQEKLIENQRAFYECGKPLDIDTNNIDLKRNKIYFHFNTEEILSDLKSLGFSWLEDIPNGYFVGYLVNTTDSIFSAKKQDRSLIMIQEAIDENGNWRPIEYWVYSGCGNSYFSPLKLEPGKYLMLPIKKYHGNYKTKARLKFKYGTDVMFSDSFDVSINKAQFKAKTDNVRGILYNGPANYLD